MVVVFTMTPTPHAITFRARPPQEVPAAISAIPREDARWIRPTFRPPPLQIVTPSLVAFGYSGTTQRTEPWASLPR